MRALVLAALMAAPAAAQDWTGRGAASLVPDWPDGAYVTGWFESDEPAKLALVSDGGARVLADDTGRRQVHLVMRQGASLAVDAASGWRFETSRVVPPTEQRAQADYLSPRIAAVTDADAFWAAVRAEGTPMVETVEGRTILTFLYRGARDNVTIFGAPDSDHGHMQRREGTDIWFRSYEVPPDTRLSYQLAPDVPQIDGTPRERRVALLATLGPDPLNRHPWGDNSTVTLPEAPAQPGFPVTDAPQVEETVWRSSILGNERRIWLHETKGFDPATGILLVMFDGAKAVGEMQIPAALDNLAAQGLPPVAAVFVDVIDGATRGRELPGSADFADALATELLPVLRERFGAVPPARVVVAGQSFGGIGAMNVATLHPEVFGNAISMSGSYWWSPEGVVPETNWMADRILAAPDLPIRAYIAAGHFEYAKGGDGDIRESSRLLYGVMRAKGYDVTWAEFSGGHDSFAWRGVLGQGLLALF